MLGNDASLHRWTLNTATGSVADDVLDMDRTGDLPSRDPRRVGRDYRYAYLAETRDNPATAEFGGLIKRDMVSGSPRDLGDRPDGPQWRVAVHPDGRRRGRGLPPVVRPRRGRRTGASWSCSTRPRWPRVRSPASNSRSVCPTASTQPGCRPDATPASDTCGSTGQHRAANVPPGGTLGTMGIELRTPTDDDWLAICHFDGRTFGATYSPEEIEQRRPLHDMARFRMAVDGGKIVGVAGSYALDATLPGSRVIPMGGVTWVAVAATHRRQGVMRRLIGAVHDDIEVRGEPLATLYASEGGIYDHVGYGAGTQVRVTSIDTRSTRMRSHVLPGTRLGPLSRRRRDRADAPDDLEPIPLDASGRDRPVASRHRVPGDLGGDPERRVHRASRTSPIATGTPRTAPRWSGTTATRPIG